MDSITITYEKPGIYPVTLKATDINTCVREDIAIGQITVFDQDFSIMPEDSICNGEQIVLNAEGGVSYEWSPQEELSNPSSKNPIASPDTTKFFKVFIRDKNGCEYEDSVLINVVPFFDADFLVEKNNSCDGLPTVIFRNNSLNATKYLWNFGDGTTSEEFHPSKVFNESDTFQVTLTSFRSFCEQQKTSNVSVIETYVPNVISPNEDGKNEQFQIITDEPVDLTIANRLGKVVYQKDNYDNSFTGTALSTGVYYYNIEFREDKQSCQGWLHILK